jgi:hypothetical protein
VPEHVLADRLHVVGGGEPPPVEEGVCARSRRERDAGARTGPELDGVGERFVDLARIAGGSHDVDDVPHQYVGHLDLAHELLRGHELIDGALRLEVGRGLGRPRDDLELLFQRGVAHRELEDEPVHLGFGQRVGALLLDGVLGGEHQERVRQRVGLVAERDLAFLHRFQQRGLHLGRRAVDLVGEQDVAEHRAEPGGELAGGGLVDLRAEQVGGQQIGRELDARELRCVLCASAFTAVVLASPGTPSIRMCPLASRPISSRSTRYFWPTSTRPISARARPSTGASCATFCSTSTTP